MNYIRLLLLKGQLKFWTEIGGATQATHGYLNATVVNRSRRVEALLYMIGVCSTAFTFLRSLETALYLTKNIINCPVFS